MIVPSDCPQCAVPIVVAIAVGEGGSVKVTIEFDNDGTIFSNGAKFARIVKVYGYK